MSNFFQELKRRNVLRVAGLYLGIGFMLIEAGSILLPLYGYSDDVFRIWVFIVVAAFPLVLTGSWFFEITASGIMTDEEAQEIQARPLLSRRKMDYVIAGVLTTALLTSLTLNYASFQQPQQTAAPASLSILISDFANQTQESLFTGTLEEALQIGVEGASFISSYPRQSALAIAQNINPGIAGLDAEHARLVAVRESIDLVLSGDALPDGSGYELRIEAIDPSTGETKLQSAVRAASKLDVLQAVSDLATDVREQLGDLEVNADDYIAESLSASNIEAVSAYVQGQAAAADRRFAEAIPHYERAIELDPKLGRAYSGWALAAAELGQTDEASRLWETAIPLLDTMSQRERYRTLALYHAVEKQDYRRAVDVYNELVEAYPADTAGYNNLAVAQFMSLNFDAAQMAGEKALEQFPNSVLYRANHALYAMYAGEVEAAANAAHAVLADQPDYAVAYLPIGLHAALSGDFEAATAAYANMTEHDVSRGLHSQADLAMYRGDFTSAAELLDKGIKWDVENGNQFAAITKTLMLAELAAAQGDTDAAIGTVASSADSLSQTQHLVQALTVLLEADPDHALVDQLQDLLAKRLQRQPRAYAAGIGAVRSAERDIVQAIDLLHDGLALADLWWLRLRLGRIYLHNGYHTEALAEFETASRRLAEGAVIYLDDTPSLRVIVDLPLLLAETQRALGMKGSARDNLNAFIQSQTGAGRAAELARAAQEMDALESASP